VLRWRGTVDGSIGAVRGEQRCGCAEKMKRVSICTLEREGRNSRDSRSCRLLRGRDPSLPRREVMTRRRSTLWVVDLKMPWSCEVSVSVDLGEEEVRWR